MKEEPTLEKKVQDEPFIEKSKHPILKVLFILLLIIGIGYGGYYYYTNYMISPFQILTKAFEKKEKVLLDKLQDNKEKQEVNGIINIELEGNDELAKLEELVNSLTLQFNSEIDINQKIINADITSKYKEDEVFRLKTYFEDNKVYFYSHDIYDKYLYVENNKDTFDFDIQEEKKMLQDIYESLKNNINKDKIEKYEEKITIDKEIDANKYVITLKDQEINDYLLKVLNDLNDIKNYQETIDDLKKSIQENAITGTISFNIYTTKSMFNPKLLSIRVTSNINEEENNLKLDFLDNDNYVIELEEKDNKIIIKLMLTDDVFNMNTAFQSNEIKVSFDIKLNSKKIDKVETIDTKNAKKLEDLTDEELQIIDDNIAKSESLSNFYHQAFDLIENEPEV